MDKGGAGRGGISLTDPRLTKWLHIKAGHLACMQAILVAIVDSSENSELFICILHALTTLLHFALLLHSTAVFISLALVLYCVLVLYFAA